MHCIATTASQPRLEEFPGAEHNTCEGEGVAGRESTPPRQESTGEVKATPILWPVNIAILFEKIPYQ